MALIIGTIGRDTLRGVVDGHDDLIFGDTDATLSSGRSADDLILRPPIRSSNQSSACSATPW